MFIGLAKYGTDLVDPAGPAAFFNTEVFNAFLIASRIGGFLICIVYVLFCVGALKNFATEQADRSCRRADRPRHRGAGDLLAVLGRDAPIGSELWGRHLSLILLAVAVIWALASKPKPSTRSASTRCTTCGGTWAPANRTEANDRHLSLASPIMANRRVRVMWADINGLSHGRYVPARRLHEHGHHAVTTLTMGINRDILPVEGYGRRCRLRRPADGAARRVASDPVGRSTPTSPSPISSTTASRWRCARAAR